jgi:hypothetical protein
MSDTPETDAFIDSLHDDWDVEFANLTAHACKLERERNQSRKELEKLKKELYNANKGEDRWFNCSQKLARFIYESGIHPKTFGEKDREKKAFYDYGELVLSCLEGKKHFNDCGTNS